MIISKITAGLGNQMFQYAIGRATAIRSASELKLDATGYAHQAAIDTKREYQLNVFRIEEKIASGQEIEKLKRSNGRIWEKILTNRVPVLAKILFPRNNNYYLENIAKKFEPRILAIRKDAYLDGWWQHEKYFLDVEKEIRKDFQFKKKLDPKNGKLLSDIKRTNAVSLHIRRTDYVNNVFTRKTHNALCGNYYQKAVGLIRKKYSGFFIYVFSDDINWARENLQFPEKTVYVGHNYGENDYKDMQLMSACKHNVIANSSFSWWAAWLNPNKNKIIVAPKKWFNDPNIDTRDRIPISWMRI